MNTPKLRFKKFNDKWAENNLDKIVTRVTRKNSNLESTIPLTISAEYGLVDQTIYFNKNVAATDLKGYYLIKKGEFAYNKSYSKNYPWGAIKRLEKSEKGVLSTLYICFSVNENTNPDYVKHYFESDKWYKEVSMIAVEGARNHGLLNISVNDFFKILIKVPSLEEQNEISLFFDKIDQKIQLQQEKIDLLKEQKKGYMLNILNNPNWKVIRLGNFSTIKGRLGWKGLKQEEYVEEGPYLIAGKHIHEGIINWDKCDKIPMHRYEESMEIALEKDDIIFSKDGSLGNPAFIKDLPNKATINSTMMLVRVDDKNKLNSNFLYHILNSHIFNKLIYQKVSGSSIPHLFQADMKEFSFKVPEDIKEQIQISDFFNALDTKIHLELKKLELLQKQKRAFMQQMFI